MKIQGELEKFIDSNSLNEQFVFSKKSSEYIERYL